jgi:two-component system response regulator NreC
MMRVLIVDDHALVRAGIALLLGHQDDMEPVGQAGTAAEAVKLARDLTPDIILLDVTMPGGGGLEALPALATAAPDAKVLMLSMHEDPNYVRAALGAGASGYVLKDAAYEELVDAIRKVAAGHAYVAPALGAKLAVRSEPDDGDDLSERER